MGLIFPVQTTVLLQGLHHWPDATVQVTADKIVSLITGMFSAI